MWWAAGGFNNAYRAAACTAAEVAAVGGSAVTVASTAKCTVLIAATAGTMVLADSQSAVWRLYSLSGLRTPLSLSSEHPGPPPGSRTLPLSRLSPEVAQVSEATGVDLAAIARQIWPA